MSSRRCKVTRWDDSEAGSKSHLDQAGSGRHPVSLLCLTTGSSQHSARQTACRRIGPAGLLPSRVKLSAPLAALFFSGSARTLVNSRSNRTSLKRTGCIDPQSQRCVRSLAVVGHAVSHGFNQVWGNVMITLRQSSHRTHLQSLCAPRLYYIRVVTYQA